VWTGVWAGEGMKKLDTVMHVLIESFLLSSMVAVKLL